MFRTQNTTIHTVYGTQCEINFKSRPTIVILGGKVKKEMTRFVETSVKSRQATEVEKELVKRDKLGAAT